MPRSGRNVDAAAIQQHPGPFVERGQIPKYAIPQQVPVVDAIDKASIGKTDKKQLRTKYTGD